MTDREEIVFTVGGPHGLVDLVTDGERYWLTGATLDRYALLLLARGVIDEATDEERAQIGAEDWL